MQKESKNVVYKVYCFNNEQGDILFFFYNSNHPCNLRGVRFELGRVKIFANSGEVFTCQITSTPHLNAAEDWNEQFFAKLFHGFTKFELQRSTDEQDSSTSFVVRDFFAQEEVFLMRAKLNEEFGGLNITDQLWNTFHRYNEEKINGVETMLKENEELKKKCDEELMKLIQLQESKEEEKRKLKGQVSALLREKEAKLLEFQSTPFTYGMEKETESIADLTEQKDSVSIAGSLFQQSQDFMFRG